MKDLIVFAGIVIYIIGAAIKAAKSIKAAPPSSPVPTGAPPRARNVSKPPQPPGGGYAGRNQQARNPEQSRAMDRAAPRLAEGAEYGAIVADRAADRAAEQRFASQVADLINSEPKAVRRTTQAQALTGQTGTLLPVSASSLEDNIPDLINAIILAEALGPPRCKFIGRR